MTGGGLAEYQRQIEALTASQLGDYSDRLGQRHLRQAKEFNDPVWKTIVLRPIEIAVLDSPLLQRLQRIRQLGVAHYVFPGAAHTRFQHSIGTLHIIEELIESLNTRDNVQVIPASARALLRLTALCHDIGHGAMSHVSDNAMTLDEACENLRLEFMGSAGLDARPSLSEMAAYYMIGSPAFRGLIEAAVRASNDRDLPEDAADKMQRAVVGLAIDDKIIGLQELISGPFDADKLDYMTRDALMAGVPAVTDIARLIRKVRYLEIEPKRAPRELQKHIAVGTKLVTVLGIAHSGGRTLDELMLGRTLLRDKIYRHQKVRAIEAMIAQVLNRIADVSNAGPGITPLLFTDEQLLDIDEPGVEAIAGRTLTVGESASIKLALRFLDLVKRRELLVRFFAFAQHMPLDPYKDDEGQSDGLALLQRDISSPDKRPELVRRIADELVLVLETIKSDLLETFPREQMADWIWLDPPEASRGINQFARAYLLTSDGDWMRFRDDYDESKIWADAYLSTRDVGYVFGPAALATHAYLAVEKVVRTVYGIRIPRSMLSYAKQDQAQVEAARRELGAAGYYARMPWDIRPTPSPLNRFDALAVADTVAERLAGYEGPRTGDATKVPHIDPQRVLDWCRQFESDELIEAALAVVSSIRMIGRDEIDGAVESFAIARSEFSGGFLCPLGTTKDSSSVVAYYAQDVAAKCNLTDCTVWEALAKTGPIVFIDDFVGRGSQAAGILEVWSGIEPSEPLHEAREPLQKHLLESLTTRKLAFLFAAGTTEGASRLEKRAQELGFDAVSQILISEGALPTAFGVTYGTATRKTAFLDRCREVGRALLSESVRDPTQLEQRTLGFGNGAYLVTFPYNTPAQTLTCLWEEGRVDDSDWLPLFPRRRKA